MVSPAETAARPAPLELLLLPELGLVLAAFVDALVCSANSWNAANVFEPVEGALIAMTIPFWQWPV